MTDRRLEDLIDSYHEYLCDVGHPATTGEIPRPDPRTLRICYMVKTSDTGLLYRISEMGVLYRIDAVTEDGETIGYRKNKLAWCDNDAAQGLAHVHTAVLDAIDDYCHRMEMQRDTSDEAMRRSHPLEM